MYELVTGMEPFLRERNAKNVQLNMTICQTITHVRKRRK
jgi:hypothetical protein